MSKDPESWAVRLPVPVFFCMQKILCSRAVVSLWPPSSLSEHFGMCSAYIALENEAGDVSLWERRREVASESTVTSWIHFLEELK